MIQKIRKSIPYLLPIVAAVLIIGLILSRVVDTDSGTPPEPEITISVDEAANHIGDVAEVCGEVASADFLPQIGGDPTFINFGRPHPNQVFTAVIWGEHRHLWQTPPDQLFEGQEICVSGEIRMHEGTPQIVVERRDQIKPKE